VRPPAGLPDMKDLVAKLTTLDRELYVICEQDLYPCDPALPLPNAIATREFLAECGLGVK
jgi:inosose dehydratase